VLNPAFILSESEVYAIEVLSRNCLGSSDCIVAISFRVWRRRLFVKRFDDAERAGADDDNHYRRGGNRSTSG